MVSATMSREIESLTHEFQRTPRIVQIGRRSNPAETVTQLIYEVSSNQKSNLLLHLLRDPKMGMVLIFCRMTKSQRTLLRFASKFRPPGSDARSSVKVVGGFAFHVPPAPGNDATACVNAHRAGPAQFWRPMRTMSSCDASCVGIMRRINFAPEILSGRPSKV